MAFFVVWITEYLHRQYDGLLRPVFLEEDDLELAEVLAFQKDIFREE